MRVYMRNKASGEIREVESDGAEFRALKTEVTSKGLPMWEQTSYAHAEAVGDRAAAGALQEEDLGHDRQEELRNAALVLSDKGVAPEANPHLALTPGEIEMGLTPQQKLEDLQAQYEPERLATRRRVFDEAADEMAEHAGKERASAPTGKGASARAGGSDSREDAPVAAGSGGE